MPEFSAQLGLLLRNEQELRTRMNYESRRNCEQSTGETPVAPEQA